MKTAHQNQQQIRAYLDAAEAIAEIIKAYTDHPQMGIRGIPSGHLYARLMGSMSFDTYRSFIDTLINLGIVKQSNFLLTYIRPDQPFPETDEHITQAQRILANIREQKRLDLSPAANE